MTKALVIARYTLKEILQSKILLGVFGLGVFNFILSFVAKEFTYGVPQKVALDFGFGSLSVALAGISIFIGVSLIPSEIENRTIFLILSRPLQRNAFILGKLLGMFSIFALTSLILWGFSMLQYFISGGSWDSILLWALLFQILEALILLLIIVNLSLVTTKALTVIIGFCIYLMGHVLHSSLSLGHVTRSDFLSSFLNFFSYLVPNFDRLNLKKHLIYQQSISFSDGSLGVLYGLLYCLGLLVICNTIFSKKDLDQ